MTRAAAGAAATRRLHLWLYGRLFARKWDDPAAIARIVAGEAVPLECYARWYERPLLAWLRLF